MTIKHPLDLSVLTETYIPPPARVIQAFLVIKQAHTPLDYLSRLDKSVPRLEEEERGGRKCNFEDTVLCIAGQQLSLFYCLWDHLTTFSVQRLQSTSQILPDYNLQRYEVLFPRSISHSWQSLYNRCDFQPAEPFGVRKTPLPSVGEAGRCSPRLQTFAAEGKGAAAAAPAGAGELPSSLGAFPKSRHCPLGSPR